MATYNVGIGQTYATWADARTAIIAAAGNPVTEEHRVYLYDDQTGSNFEFIDQSVIPFTTEFPLVIDGSTGGGISTSVVNSAQNVCAIIFKDVDIQTGDFRTSGNLVETFILDGVTGSLGTTQATYAIPNILIKNCHFKWTYYYHSHQSGQITIRDSIIETDRMHIRAWASSFIIENSIIVQSATSIYQLFESVAGFQYPSNIRAVHSTFIGNGSQNCFEVYQAMAGISIKNCIFHNFDRVIEQSGKYIETQVLDMDGNHYSNCSGIIDSRITNIAGMQGVGLETDGVEGVITFASTTWGDADYYRLSSTLGNSKSAGIHTDIDGNSRESFTGLDAGACQYAPPPTVSPDDILKSAGGNYNDDNLIASNIKSGTLFGLSQTGTYDNRPDDNYILEVEGGNYHDPENSEVLLNARVGVAPRVGSLDPDYPDKENVLENDTTNGIQGDIPLSDVLSSSGGTLVLDYPDKENVLENDTTNGVQGDIPLSDVLVSSGGTLNPDYPDKENVLENDTTNGIQGDIPLNNVLQESGGNLTIQKIVINGIPGKE